MSYTLETDDQMPGHEVLVRDGQIISCPYQPPLISPGKLQHQAILTYRPCGSWCALFHKNNNHVTQSCGSGNTVRIDDDAPKKSTGLHTVN